MITENSGLDSGHLPMLTSGDNIIQISDEAHAEPIANYADNTNPRIVAWCMDKTNPYTFAVYFNNQNIKLIR